MLKWLGSLRDSNEREISKLRPIVEKVNALEPECLKLSDEALKNRTTELKKIITDATANERREVEATRQELKEQQACSLAQMTEDQKEELSQKCHNIQEKIDSLDKELRKEENKVLDEILPEAFASPGIAVQAPHFQSTTLA